MTKHEAIAGILETGIIPAIRVSSAEDALFAAEAVIQGGIEILEIPTTVPGAFGVISNLIRKHPHAVVGAGTVLDLDTARGCLDAGAVFLTSPGFDPEITEFALTNHLLSIPGALTPSEVMRARIAGADFIKIFPCAPVGGASYIRALKAPFADLPLIASGGVNQKTAAGFMRAGAAALGIGEDLIPGEAVHLRNASWIQELARRFRGMVKDGMAKNGRPKNMKR